MSKNISLMGNKEYIDKELKDKADKVHTHTPEEVGINTENLTTKDEFSSHLADDVSHIQFAVATGTANTYAVALNPVPTAYKEGMGIAVAINADSTGASTLNVNGLGAIPIKKANGNDVTNLKANGVYTFRYSNGNFILQGEGGEYGTAQAPQVLSGYTYGTEEGIKSGTMPNRGTFNLGLNEIVPAGYYSGGRTPDGKMWAEGFITYPQKNMDITTISNLPFTPSIVAIYLYDDSNSKGMFFILIRDNAFPFNNARLHSVNASQEDMPQPVTGPEPREEYKIITNGFTFKPRYSYARETRYKYIAYE